MNLALSLIALALGPLLYSACQKMVLIRSALDGLLFVTIAGIVMIHIVPAVFAVAGFAALLSFAAGVGAAFLIERRPDLDGSDRYAWIVLLGALGLVIHAAMDGVALLPGDHLHADRDPGSESDVHNDEKASGLAGLFSNHLAIGVILHRIPVGMAIWWAVRPRLGSAVAICALAIIAVATSAAYLLGEPVIELMEVKSVALFQAFVAGTLLHVIVFSSVQRDATPGGDDHDHRVIGERLGVIAGLFILYLVPHAH